MTPPSAQRPPSLRAVKQALKRAEDELYWLTRAKQSGLDPNQRMAVMWVVKRVSLAMVSLICAAVSVAMVMEGVGSEGGGAAVALVLAAVLAVASVHYARALQSVRRPVEVPPGHLDQRIGELHAETARLAAQIAEYRASALR